MRVLLSVLLLAAFHLSRAQHELPFYYEKNLPLYGKPDSVAEYYYEYHTQAKAHYYNHYLTYDPQGRIQKHIKTNLGLLDLDEIPMPFHEIIDTRPVTITYTFQYDASGRISRFVRHQFQEEVGVFQQDEEWKYDTYGMLYVHSFLEVSATDTVIKNPSSARNIYRDSEGRVVKIEKLSYSFANKGLVLTGEENYFYGSGILDSMLTYKVVNGTKSFEDKKSDFVFKRYDPLNPDSMLFQSYWKKINDGTLTEVVYSYDAEKRITSEVIRDSDQDTLSATTYTYDPLKTTEASDGYVLEVYYDETGYERYREEFMNEVSLAVPSDLNTRTIEDGKVVTGLLEIWDPVTLFYRKDTEYIYFYDQLTALYSAKEVSAGLVFPNPTSGMLFIRHWENVAQLQLSDASGRRIDLDIEEKLNLDVPPGMYMLTILYKDEASERVKVVVE